MIKKIMLGLGALGTAGLMAFAVITAGGGGVSTIEAVDPTCTHPFARTPTPAVPTVTPSATPTGPMCEAQSDPYGDDRKIGGAFTSLTVPQWRLDVNNDNTYGSIDGAFINALTHLYAAVPTTTATPTATSTATPSTQTNSFGQWLDDNEGHHVAVINGRDSLLYTEDEDEGWGYKAHFGNEDPPGSGFDSASGWGSILWPEIATVRSGVTVDIRNFEVWVFNDASPDVWTQLDVDFYGWQHNNAVCSAGGIVDDGLTEPVPMPTTTQFYDNGDDPDYEWPDCMQIFTDHDDNAFSALSIDGIYVRYEARLIGSEAQDIILANAGADWWDGSTNFGAFEGKFKRLSSNWQWVQGSSMDNAQLSSFGITTLP